MVLCRCFFHFLYVITVLRYYTSIFANFFPHFLCYYLVTLLRALLRNSVSSLQFTAALCSFKCYSGYVCYHLITLIRDYVKGKCFIFPFSTLLPRYAIMGAFFNIILFANVITLLRYYAVTQLTMFFTSGCFPIF